MYLWGVCYFKFNNNRKSSQRDSCVEWRPKKCLEEYCFEDVWLGTSHAFAQTVNRVVLRWGLNHSYALAIKQSGKIIHTEDADQLYLSKEKEEIINISVYNFTHVALTSKNVYVWGRWKGVEIYKPLKLVSNNTFAKVCAGEGFAIAVTGGDFEVWSAGVNSNCQVSFYLFHLSSNFLTKPFYKLGIGDRVDREEFTKVNLDTKTNIMKKKSESIKKILDNKLIFIEDIDIACSNFTILKYGMEMYIWGNIADQIVNQPLYLTEFENVQVKHFAIFELFGMVDIGLNNLGNIRFVSFDPPVVHSGTIEALTVYLFEDSSSDYPEIFFITYPIYTSSYEILCLIIKKYENAQKETKSLKEYSALKQKFKIFFYFYLYFYFFYFKFKFKFIFIFIFVFIGQ